MALYQLMRAHTDGGMSQVGKSNPSLNRMSVRLKKLTRGWIQIVNPDTTKTIIKARGFSKQAMAAIKSCGIEAC